jgi:hypothetical protein
MEEKMVMVGHQTIGGDFYMKKPCRLPEYVKE